MGQIGTGACDCDNPTQDKVRILRAWRMNDQLERDLRSICLGVKKREIKKKRKKKKKRVPSKHVEE